MTTTIPPPRASLPSKQGNGNANAATGDKIRPGISVVRFAARVYPPGSTMTQVWMCTNTRAIARGRKHTLKRDSNRKLDWWNVPDEHPEEGLRANAHTCAHQVQEVLRQSFRSPLQAFVFLEQNTDGRDLLRRAEIMLGLQRLGLSRVDPSEVLQRLDPSESGVISVRAFLETLAWGLLPLPLFRTYFVCAPATKHTRGYIHVYTHVCICTHTNAHTNTHVKTC